MKEEKCLVTEAMDKCQCEWCKMFRQMREDNLKWYVSQEILKIKQKAMMEDSK